MSFRVNTLHHVTADVNTSVGLMALQVSFFPHFKWKSQTRSQDILSTVGEMNHLHPDTPTQSDVSRGIQFQNRLPTFIKAKIKTES